jgi:hypothetical protein
MKKYNFIFLCLVRDCEDTLDIFFDFIKTFPKKIPLKVIFGENNSKDNSKTLINDFIKTNDIDIKLLNLKRLNSIDDRIKRITKGRHLLKNYILKNKLKSDFVCIMDVDDVLLNKTSLNLKNFMNLAKNLKKNKKKFNGISVGSKPYYYDILAFKSSELELPNILEIQKSRKILNAYKMRQKYIYTPQKKITKRKNMITISSFNGLCIYNYNDYILGDYYYKSKISLENNFLNEHMKMNISLNNINKKKILIDNNFKLNTPKEHIPAKSLIDLFFKKILNYLPKFF